MSFQQKYNQFYNNQMSSSKREQLLFGSSLKRNVPLERIQGDSTFLLNISKKYATTDLGGKDEKPSVLYNNKTGVETFQKRLDIEPPKQQVITIEDLDDLGSIPRQPQPQPQQAQKHFPIQTSKPTDIFTQLTKNTTQQLKIDNFFVKDQPHYPISYFPTIPVPGKLLNNQFFQDSKFNAGQCKLLKSAIGQSPSHHNQNRNANNSHQNSGAKVIDMSKMDEKELQRTLDILGKNSNQTHQQQQQQKEKHQLEEFQKRITDKDAIKKGEQIVQEFIKEELRGPSYHKIIKRKNAEQDQASKSLNTYNILLQDEHNNNYGLRKKTPVVEFNFLLKYLFKRGFEQTEEQDHKVIPDYFQSSEEYQKIFEYLFLNECFAQMQKELQDFMKDKNNNLRYRKLQVKVDEKQQDKDGTILEVRPPSKEAANVVEKVDQKKNQDSDDSDDNQKEIIQDGNCDLMLLKNQIVIISKGINITGTTQFNKKLTEKNAFIFGWLLEPQKAQYLTQLRILTFVDPNYFLGWTDIVLQPFQKVSTQIREFMMIKKLQEEAEFISQIIYNPNKVRTLIPQQQQNGASNIQSSRALTQYFDNARPHYNESQFNCIQEISLADQGICLLQGPPGTGKTHTLLGIVSALYNQMKIYGTIGKRKILVLICAPSNAAIDEILVRIIKGGVKDEMGDPIKVNVLRIGQIDPEEGNGVIQLRDYSLEDLAQRKLFQSQDKKAQLDQRTTSDIRMELSTLQIKIAKLIKRKSQVSDKQEVNKINDEVDGLQIKKRELYYYLDDVKNTKKRAKEQYKQQINYLLEKAEIICTTLASSGSDKLDRFKGLIDTVIIDEAAQCTEPTNIIPLRLNMRKMILIGDPKQLPATTFSQISNKTLYNRSLFERILQNGTIQQKIIYLDFKPYFLDIQYRMNPEIRNFPSKMFYQNKLKDHSSINDRQVNWELPFQNVVLFDCAYGKETNIRDSYQNHDELQIVMKLLVHFRITTPSVSIGVICGYKSQVTLIKKSFKDQHPKLFDKSMLNINTIDSFQGQEKDLIIFSCVRSNREQKVGFLSDQRRINVALTRARQSLIVIGNCVTVSTDYQFILHQLCVDICWKQYIQNMLERNLYVHLSNEVNVDKYLTNELKEEDCKNNLLTINLLDYISHHLSTLLAMDSKNKRKLNVYNMNDFAKQEKSDALAKVEGLDVNGIKTSIEGAEFKDKWKEYDKAKQREKQIAKDHKHKHRETNQQQNKHHSKQVDKQKSGDHYSKQEPKLEKRKEQPQHQMMNNHEKNEQKQIKHSQDHYQSKRYSSPLTINSSGVVASDEKMLKQSQQVQSKTCTQVVDTIDAFLASINL